MSDEPELQAVKEAVLRFAREWTVWETGAWKRGDSLSDPATIQAHAALIARHCAVRKRVYVDGLPTCGDPPTYRDVVEENLIHAELVAPRRALG